MVDQNSVKKYKYLTFKVQAEIDTTKSYYKFVKSQDEMAWSN